MYDPDALISHPDRVDLRLLEHARTGDVEDADRLLIKLIDDSSKQPEVFGRFRLDIEAAEAAGTATEPAETTRLLVILAEELIDAHLEQVAALVLGRARRDQPRLAHLAAGETGGGSRPALEALADLDNATGVLALRWGQIDTALELLLRSNEYADLAGSRDLVAATTLNLSHVWAFRGDDEEARRYALLSLRAAEETHHTASIIKACLTLAQGSHPTQGDDDRRSFAEQALAAAINLRAPSLTASAHTALGLTQSAAGDSTEAERSFKLALAAARRAHSPERQVVALQNLAAVATDTDRDTLAAQRLQAAVELSEAAAGQPRLETLLDALARAQFRRGEVQAALATSDRLVAALGDRPERLARAQALRGALLLETDRVTEAVQVLTAAQQVLLAEAPGHVEAGLATQNLAVAHALAGTLSTITGDLVGWATRLAQYGHGAVVGQIALILSADGYEWHDVASTLARLAAGGANGDDRFISSMTLASQLRGAGAAAVSVDLLRPVVDALTATDDSEDRALLSDARNDLAVALLDRRQPGDYDEAYKLLMLNVSQAERDRDRIVAALAYTNLTELYRRRDHDGDHDRAVDAATRTLELAEDLDDPEQRAAARLELALVHLDVEDAEAAAAALDSPASRADVSQRREVLWVQGHVALIRGQADVAVAAYTEALALVDPTDRRGKYAALARLCPALAAAGDRRRYMRRLQQLIDISQALPFRLTVASDLARPARSWSKRGKPNFAGETLALCLIVGAVHSADSSKADGDESADASDNQASNGPARDILGVDSGEPDDNEAVQAVVVAALAVAVELLREQADGEPWTETLASLEKELYEQFSSRDAVDSLLYILDRALEHYQGSHETDAGRDPAEDS